MKAFLEFMTLFGLGRIYALISSLVKGCFIRCYIELVARLRNVFVVVVLSIVCLLLLLTGFLLLHIVLFLYLSWSLSDKLVLMLVLGSSYMVIPLLLIGYLQSRSYWLKISGAKNMVDELSSKKE